MSNTKKMPRRKGEKKIELVSFPVDGFDGEFEVPKLSALSLGVQRKLQAGDVSPMVEALGEYGEIVDDMTGDEVQAFMDAWAEASGVELGKSEPAAS